MYTLGKTVDYLYASVTKVKKDDKDELYSTACKDVHTASYMEIPFDHQIQTTLPIVLSEMCKYVEGCHSDSNNAFLTQFEVNSGVNRWQINFVKHSMI